MISPMDNLAMLVGFFQKKIPPVNCCAATSFYISSYLKKIFAAIFQVCHLLKEIGFKLASSNMKDKNKSLTNIFNYGCSTVTQILT